MKREPHVRAEYDRALRLKHKYGITVEEYDSLLEAQGGVCAICHLPETASRQNGTRPLAVDHDHRTGRVRGLLCGQCNTALGKFRDDPNLLFEAALYLTKNTCCEGEPVSPPRVERSSQPSEGQ